MTRRAERIRPYTKKHVTGEQYLSSPNTSLRLCQRLEIEVAGRPGREQQGEGWQGFPWLSLIIGTGCLQVPGASAGIADALRSTLQRKLDQSGTWDLAADPELVLQFTHSLAMNRLMSGRGRPGAQETAESAQIEASDQAVEVVVAAALLTSLYHQINTASPRAMSRWDNDEAVFDLTAGGTMNEAIEAWSLQTLRAVETARTALKQRIDAVPFGDEDPETHVLKAVHALLQEIYNDLSQQDWQRVIAVQRVRLLTEVAWYFLIRDTAVYPGWTDLLLRLMLSQSTQGERRSPRRPRPRYQNLRELVETAESILIRATEASWQANKDAHLDRFSRQHLYRAAAETLWAQAEAREQSLVAGSFDLPPAAAFTTTLDLELEMALTERRRDKSFRVAVPVYVMSHKDADEAHFRWLMGDVPPAPSDTDLGGLHRLRQPENWRVLDDRRFQYETSFDPMVIHLSGSPLLELPRAGRVPSELKRQMSEDGIEVTPKTLFVSAITVDEYLAMRQSEVELSLLNRDGANPRARVGHGLPKALTQPSSKAGTKRFWLTLGVLMADPAVRNRVLSQLAGVHRLERESAPVAGAAETGGQLGEPDEPLVIGSDEIHGAAINLHIDDDEVALLHWLGLDVVEQSVHDYTRELLHYAEHVAADDQHKRPELMSRCSYRGGRK